MGTRDVITYGGRAAAVIEDDVVFLLPPISVLESDHPVRRFVGMMALVGREMQVGPDREPYDDALAGFYVRSALMHDDEFLAVDDGRSDAALAEHFNVPLVEVEAKRYDLAYRRPAGPAGRRPH